MRSSLVVSCCLSGLFLIPIYAQDYEPSLTEFGHPDLQGVWNFSTYAPFERPEGLGDREFYSQGELETAAQNRANSAINRDQRETEIAQQALESMNSTSVASVNYFWMEREGLAENNRTSVIIYPPNGRIPTLQDNIKIQHSDQNGVREIPGERPVRYTHGGIARNGPEDRGLSERCMIGFNAGPPLSGGGYNANIQIVQNRDHAVIMTEMVHDARIVPLDNDRSLDDNIRLWTGDSRGYYEGDTLVVETKNFSELLPSFPPFGTAKDKVLTERFTRVNYSTIDYQWTLEDPSTFTDTITAQLPMTKVAGQLYEYACHEGNYGMINILRGARADERRANEAGSGD